LRRKGLAEWHRHAAGRRGHEIGFSRINRVDSPGCSRLNRLCHGKETPAQRAHRQPQGSVSKERQSLLRPSRRSQSKTKIFLTKHQTGVLGSRDLHGDFRRIRDDAAGAGVAGSGMNWSPPSCRCREHPLPAIPSFPALSLRPSAAFGTSHQISPARSSRRGEAVRLVFACLARH
jgi:hypothetical protein